MKRTVAMGLLTVLAAGFLVVAAPGAGAVSTVTTIDAGIGENPQAIALSSDGAYGLVGSDGSVQVITTSTNTVSDSVPNDAFGGLRVLQFLPLPGGSSFVASNQSGAYLVEIDNGQVSTVSEFAHPDPNYSVLSVAVTPDGKDVWALTTNVNLQLYRLWSWSVETLDIRQIVNMTSWSTSDSDLPTLLIGPNAATAYALFPGLLADSELVVFDLATKTVSATVTIDDDVRSMAMSPDGQTILVTSTWDDVVMAYGPDGDLLRTVATVDNANQVIFTPDSRHAYVSSTEHVHMIATSSLTEVEDFSAGFQAFGLAMTPDATALYVTNNIDNGTVTVVDIPAITPASQRIVATVGTSFESTPLTASGFSTAPPAFALTAGPTLPDGVVFDPTTGQLSGTPTERSAEQTFEITASESSGVETAAATVTLSVDPEPILVPANQERTAVVGSPFASPALSPRHFTSAPLFTVSPTLPTGLAIDPSSGSVAGTPDLAEPATNYTITATAGADTATSNLVLRIAPALTPSNQPVVVDVNEMFSTAAVTTEGFSVDPVFSIAPALPEGLTLDTTSGVVSGVAPTALRQLYTLTATGAGVTGTASLPLTVNPTLTPPSGALSLTAGTPVDRALVTASGFPGPVTYTTDPALPAGVAITPTGALVGTPTAASAASGYGVTATSGRWRASTDVTITVAPALSPPSRSAEAGVGQRVDIAGPTALGFPGAVAYSVSPSLPDGLVLDTGTGQVTGAAKAGHPSTVYTLTGSGSGFTATAALTLSVAALEPATQEIAGRVGNALRSARMDARFFRGPVTYSVSPTPPAWLTLNASTGVLSGTPTGALARRVYVITATDGAARTDARVAIQVAAVPSPRPSPAPQPTLAPEPTPEPVPTETRVPSDSASTAPGASTPKASPGVSSDPSSTDQASASDPLLWAVGAGLGLVVLIGVAVVGTTIVRGRRGGA